MPGTSRRRPALDPALAALAAAETSAGRLVRVSVASGESYVGIVDVSPTAVTVRNPRGDVVAAIRADAVTAVRAIRAVMPSARVDVSAEDRVMARAFARPAGSGSACGG